MIRQLLRSRRRRVLIDVSTQRDLLLAEGKACIKNHRRVLMNLRRMIAWARRRGIPVISTCEVYPDNNGGSATNYCLAGTNGQKKIPYTLLGKRISFPADNDATLPANVLRHYKQIVLQNRSSDPFDEPKIERLLTEVKAGEFILVGAEAEGTVKEMALGLLQRKKNVKVVTDAIGSHNSKEARLAFRKMKAKGAKLVDTKMLAGKSHLKYIGICNCKTCLKAAGKNGD